MTSTAFRCGLPVQPGPPQPTDQAPVVDALVRTPRIVGPDGGLDAEQRSEWGDR